MKLWKNLKNKIHDIKIEETLIENERIKKAKRKSFSYAFVIFTPIFLLIFNIAVYEVSNYHLLLIIAVFFSHVVFWKNYIYYRLLGLNNYSFPIIWGLLILAITVFTLIILNDFNVFG